MTAITFCLCAFGTEKMLMLVFLKIWAFCVKLRGVAIDYIKMSTLQFVCVVDVCGGEKLFSHMLCKIPMPAWVSSGKSSKSEFALQAQMVLSPLPSHYKTQEPIIIVIRHALSFER